MGEAARALTGLHTLGTVRFKDPADAWDTVAAWRLLVVAGVRHAGLLAPGDPAVRSLPRLRPARRPARQGGGGPLHPAGQALVTSAAALRVAHDVLASHLGPERQHRTADAVLIESEGASGRALRDVSSLLVTAAVAHQPLARRCMDLHPGGGRMPDPVARILGEGVALLGPAYRMYEQAGDAVVGDPLGALSVAPALTVASSRNEPAGQLIAALSRLQLAAHRQSVGDLPSGAPTMRALSTVAITLIHRDLTEGGNSLPAAAGSFLLKSGKSWSRLHQAWGRVATLEAGSRGVLHDSVIAATLLSKSDMTWPGRDRSHPVSADTEALGPSTRDWLHQVAVSMSATTTRLAAEGPILVPTRWLEDADVPRPWAPAGREQVGWLSSLHAATVRDSGLADRPAWSPNRSHLGILAETPAPTAALVRTS